MRCRSVRRLLGGHVHGELSPRRERKVDAHLLGCEDCAREEERAALVADLLPAWSDVAEPEDALHRLETRLAFLPPAPLLPAPRRLRSFALPYAAGLATAATILLVFFSFAGGPAPAPESERPALLEGERLLTDAPASEDLRGFRPVSTTASGVIFTTKEGEIVEIPWNDRTEPFLRRVMEPGLYDRIRQQVRYQAVEHDRSWR